MQICLKTQCPAISALSVFVTSTTSNKFLYLVFNYAQKEKLHGVIKCVMSFDILYPHEISFYCNLVYDLYFFPLQMRFQGLRGLDTKGQLILKLEGPWRLVEMSRLTLKLEWQRERISLNEWKLMCMILIIFPCPLDVTSNLPLPLWGESNITGTPFHTSQPFYLLYFIMWKGSHEIDNKHHSIENPSAFIFLLPALENPWPHEFWNQFPWHNLWIDFKALDKRPQHGVSYSSQGRLLRLSYWYFKVRVGIEVGMSMTLTYIITRCCKLQFKG